MATTSSAPLPDASRPRRSRRRPVVGSPAAPALVASTGAALFVVARLVVAAHGNISVFIVAGSTHSSSSLVARGIVVQPGDGYDGQFYYRMALDPADLSRSAFGIRLDTMSRLERIVYPAISWLLAAGHPSLVPDTLVATNVVGLGALGWGGGMIALDGGHRPLWGLVLPGYWGYLWSTGRDLTEVTAAALLVLGLIAYRRRRPVLAGVVLLAAVLAKETAAYVVVVIAVVRIVTWWTGRDRRAPATGGPVAPGGPSPSGTGGLLGVGDVSWALPLAGFAAWEGVVLAATGTLPIRGSGNANLGVPFAGLVAGFRHYVDALPSTASLLWFVELAVLVVVAIVAGLAIRSTTAPLHERVAWGAVVVLAIATAQGIWLGDVGFRSLDDVWLLSWIVLLGAPSTALSPSTGRLAPGGQVPSSEPHPSPARRLLRSAGDRRLRLLAAITAALWLVVAVELVRFV